MVRNSVGFFVMMVGIPAWAASVPAEIPGCQDLKLLPRVLGCVITECSTKRLESVKIQTSGGDTQNVQGPSSTVKYSCATLTLERLMAELLPAIQKAEYQVVYQDEEGESRLITAKKGAEWLDIDTSLDDNGALYSLTLVETGAPKPLAGDVCSEAPAFPLPAGCALTDCTAKRKDTLQMRYSEKTQIDLSGAARISGIACQAPVTPGTFFDSAIAALKESGYTQVFTQREKPEYSWLTVRQGKRWLELMSFQDAEAINFQITDVQALADPKLR